jgi:BlaI family penicillinase repressor
MKPTESELSILQILWQKKRATVREVNDLLNVESNTEIGYTTTLKLMQIMAEKKLVERDTNQKVHIYYANVSETDTQQILVNNFVDNAFRGSAMKLVLHALGNHETSQDELNEIKDLIQKLENNL